VSAGASGAIFGVAGGLVALLGMKKAQIPSASMKQTFKSLLFFIGYNLLYGMRGGIDNAAHLGGLLSGAALGAFMPRRVQENASAPSISQSPQTTSETPDSSRFKLAGVALVCLLLVGFGLVRRAHGPVASQVEIMEMELFKLGKEDRSNILEAEKQLQAGQTDPAIAKLKTVTVRAPASSMAHAILGEAYNQKEQYDEAIQELHKAIALEPNYALAHADLGAALVNNRQYDQAIQELRTALRLDPNDTDAHNNLGVALEQTGDLKGALEEYRMACTLDPKDATYEKNFKRLLQEVNK
jgi:tetratricopeptide (TPR) repeat protein